jgi:uncharacterized damage-inducible protein DinB
MSCIRLIAAAVVAVAVFPMTGLAAEPTPPPPGVRGDLLVWISDAETKLNELAQTVPEGKFNWKPGKDIRSVGDVFMHVAAANYGIPAFLGVPAPEGFNLATYEKTLTKKADVAKAMADSFVHVKAAITNAKDADLDKPVEFFGTKTTVRGAYMIVLAHAHEHLGQSIAYARMNKITPPWTARDMAQAAEAKKKAEK